MTNQIRKVLKTPGASITQEMVDDSKVLAENIGTNGADALMRILLDGGVVKYEEGCSQEATCPQE